MDFSPYLPYLPYALGAVAVVWLAYQYRKELLSFLPSGDDADNDDGAEVHKPLTDAEAFRLYSTLRSCLHHCGESDAVAALQDHVLPAIGRLADRELENHEA